MSRLKFNQQGQLVGVDQTTLQTPLSKKISNLKTSESLEFLKEKALDSIFDKKYWSLYEKEKPLPPLKFSNGKTQEDVVEEIVNLIQNGNKIIFLHGVCGTGKSAIALNIARALGRASIVVPIKSLQRQYEEEYMGKKHVINSSSKKMKIAMLTGRDNHDSIYSPGKSCADPYLPDTIKITEKNAAKIKEYYQENPFISSTSPPTLKTLKRISIAPANPYWSPILPAQIEINHLKDAKKRKYIGMNGNEYILYHRKPGCSYYDQYLSYIDADTIIFNSAKYLSEIAIGRKPQSEVDIIDEADEFLDKLSSSIEINLSRLDNALKVILPDSDRAIESIRKIRELLKLEEQKKRALGVDENEVFHINETKIEEIIKTLLTNTELQSEILIDEMSYANIALEAAREFSSALKSTYLTYKKDEEGNLYVTLVTTNLASKFSKIVNGSKALVLMSGTLHSNEVLKHIFGIENFITVEAETLNQGSIEIMRTGKEIDCKYSNLQSIENSREIYLKALSAAIDKAPRPSLIHVNAFHDLPSSNEMSFELAGLMPREELKSIQFDDKTGKAVSLFKSGMSDKLFTTKCSRGIDFPGDTCRSVIFTKYPNANVKDTFWKILQKTHSNYYWEFYRDKAHRDFLQRIYRAIRSENDHVFVLSPDSRVLDAVRELQINGNN